MLSFSSAQKAWSTGVVQITLYAIGWLSSLPCRHCVKSANSAPGGKASLVIGSRKNVSETERNVLLFSRPFCRANSNPNGDDPTMQNSYNSHTRAMMKTSSQTFQIHQSSYPGGCYNVRSASLFLLSSLFEQPLSSANISYLKSDGSGCWIGMNNWAYIDTHLVGRASTHSSVSSWVSALLSGCRPTYIEK